VQPAAKPSAHHDERLPMLVLAAIGVVYGDIGTSPLYTLREAFGERTGLVPTPASVLGILRSSSGRCS
jgi:KUP system potassium uptake protein